MGIAVNTWAWSWSTFSAGLLSVVAIVLGVEVCISYARRGALATEDGGPDE